MTHEPKSHMTGDIKRKFHIEIFGGISEWRDHGWGWQYFRTFNLCDREA